MFVIDENWSGWTVSLDDGDSVILIASSSPGNSASLPPDLPLDDFPAGYTS
ncbi:MAG: hypothetical protein FWF44_07885 [Defluviitaleaceae bacterium]|nr:hypothetical protein [Defluviitaleaceae bacterium]